MKKRLTWTNILLIILILVFSVCAFGIFRLQSGLNAIASDFRNLKTEENQPVTADSAFFDLYSGIYSNLEAYGAADAYGKQTTDLANEVYARTFQKAEVTSVEYKNDEMIFHIRSAGIPLSSFDTALWTKAVTGAAASFLSKHFFDAAVSLFKGEDAIKEMLYTQFGQDIFDSLNEQIASLPEQTVNYSLIIQMSENGWNVKIEEDSAALDNSSDTSQNSHSASSSNNSSNQSSNPSTDQVLQQS